MSRWGQCRAHLILLPRTEMKILSSVRVWGVVSMEEKMPALKVRSGNGLQEADGGMFVPLNIHLYYLYNYNDKNTQEIVYTLQLTFLD